MIGLQPRKWNQSAVGVSASLLLKAVIGFDTMDHLPNQRDYQMIGKDFLGSTPQEIRREKEEKEKQKPLCISEMDRKSI